MLDYVLKCHVFGTQSCHVFTTQSRVSTALKDTGVGNIVRKGENAGNQRRRWMHRLKIKVNPFPNEQF